MTGAGDDLGSTVGIGVRADGKLNIGQNTTGNTVALGFQSGQAITSGLHNTFVGYGSGQRTTIWADNTFTGRGSGDVNLTGSSNTFTGSSSGGANTTGGSNTFLGMNTGVVNTDGQENTFVGRSSGDSNTSGDQNTFVGRDAGDFNSTGSQNTALGFGASPSSAALTNATAIGYLARVSASNALVLGGTGTAAVEVAIGFTNPSFTLDVNGGSRCVGAVNTTSDARLKTAIRPIGQALAGVLALRGVRYTFRQADFPQLKLPAGEQLGLLAQEVEKVYSKLVSTDKAGFKSVNYVQLTPVLIEALREQQAQLDAMRSQATHDHADLQALKAQLARLLGEAAPPATAQARP